MDPDQLSSHLCPILFLTFVKLSYLNLSASQKKAKASCFPRPLTPKNKNVVSGQSGALLQPALSPVSMLLISRRPHHVVILLSDDGVVLSGGSPAVHDVHHRQHAQEEQLPEEEPQQAAQLHPQVSGSQRQEVASSDVIAPRSGEPALQKHCRWTGRQDRQLLHPPGGD